MALSGQTGCGNTLISSALRTNSRVLPLIEDYDNGLRFVLHTWIDRHGSKAIPKSLNRRPGRLGPCSILTVAAHIVNISG